MTETYNFVQEAIFSSDENLKLLTRNTLLSDIKEERKTQQIINILVKVIGAFFAICFLCLAFFLPLMFIPFIVCLLVLLYVNQGADEKTKIEIYYSQNYNSIEYLDHLSNKQIKIYNPQKIKIVTRLYSHKYNIIHLSVDIVGILDSDEKKQLSNIRLVCFKYRTLENAKSRVEAAAIEFKFLADWLKIPILAEKDAYYYDTNCKVY